jgi:hypothetical protein
MLPRCSSIDLFSRCYKLSALDVAKAREDTTVSLEVRGEVWLLRVVASLIDGNQQISMWGNDTIPLPASGH